MINKRIVVHSDDPDQPQLPLLLKAQLLVDVIAVPRSLQIRDLKVGEAGTGSFELRLSEGAEAELLSVTLEDEENFTLTRLPDAPGEGEADSPAIAEFEGEAAEGSVDGRAPVGATLARYEVRFRGRDDVGTSSTKVRVATTGPNTPELIIGVNASAAKNLRYLKTVRFIRKNDELMARQIHISARHGDVPTIKKVEDPDGLLEIEILAPRGKLASIAVSVREGAWEALDAAGKAKQHELTIRTSDREEPKLVIMYSVAPKSKAAGKSAKPTPTLIAPIHGEEAH